MMTSDDDLIAGHDPLREEFEQLERDVAARELTKRQAACPHIQTSSVQQFSGRNWAVCQKCGAVLPDNS